MSQPITEEIANESERTDSGKVAIENHLSVREKQTIKSIIATIEEITRIAIAVRNWTANQKANCPKQAQSTLRTNRN